MTDMYFYGIDPIAERLEIDQMTSPVRCNHCGRIYDLGKVTVEARYLDCSVWKCPHCSVTVDDRTWKSRPDFAYIPRATA